MEHEIEMIEPGTKVIRLDGELDASQALTLREVLSAQLDDCSVVLDMAGVPFIDSSGIGVLVAAHRKATKTGGSLVIANPTEPVAKVLALTRTDKVLNLQGDLDAAISAVCG